MQRNMNSKENENEKIGRKECNEITKSGKVPFVWDTVSLEYKDIVAKHVSAKGRHTNSKREEKENVQAFDGKENEKIQYPQCTKSMQRNDDG